MQSFSSGALRLALLAVVLLLLTACGRKGPVRPLLTSLPAAPQQLRIDQQGESFLVSWHLPANNQDGTDAEDIGGFRIYRSEYDVTEGCPTCREPQDLVAKIDLRYPTTQLIRDRFYWRDLEISEGSGYRYRIVPVTVGGQQGEAAMTHRDRRSPPEPPGLFRVQVEEELALLSWAAPDPLPEGAVLVGYNLYRRSGVSQFPVVPLNATPLEVSELIDRSLQRGRTYAYQVSTLVLVDNTLLESAPTEAVQITLPLSE